MRISALAHDAATRRLRAFYVLTKPRVNTLIVFCAVIGMFLGAPDGLPDAMRVFAATVGIACVAGAAAAMNCLVEQQIDARMARTRGRPLPRGELGSAEVLVFAGVLGGFGLSVLYQAVNPLTMWLTLATFVGYAVVYTVFLKPRTPQNIVIGGAAGAMPPVLGWAATTGTAPLEAWLLFLVILVWTPPHFWSLALYRTREYAAAGFPMLPVVRGRRHTQRSIVAYTVALALASVLPVAVGMSGPLYLAAALALDARFVVLAWRALRSDLDADARSTFRYSITYLSALFAALLLDHHLAA